MLLAIAQVAVSPARDEWYDCLDRYAQVAMQSDRSSWEVAQDAILTCSDERQTYQLQLFRAAPSAGGSDDGPAFARRLADDDMAAAIRAVEFVNRNRRPR